MELSDQTIIEALLAGMDHSFRSIPEKSKAAEPRPAKMVRRSRCACGECAQCKDNQRWESIYNAKFADPNYYSNRPVRHSSSLDRAS
jgi:hypothetical protein